MSFSITQIESKRKSLELKQRQEFLEEQKKKAKQERDNHLCKLGLYDLEKCTKSYSASPWKNEEDARNFGY